MAIAPPSRSPVSCPPPPAPSQTQELGPVKKPEEGAQVQRQQEAEKTRPQPAPQDSFEASRKQLNPSDPASKPESNKAPQKQQPQPQPQPFGKDERYVNRLEDAYKDLSPKEIKQGNIQDPVKTLAESEQQTLEAILDNIKAAAGEVASA